MWARGPNVTRISSLGSQQKGLEITDVLHAPPVPTSLKLMSSVTPPATKVASAIPEEKHGETENDRVFKKKTKTQQLCKW